VLDDIAPNGWERSPAARLLPPVRGACVQGGWNEVE
jgi:hypothetical protein